MLILTLLILNMMVVMRVMMFEMDEMMASEGPPDRSTRLDSREALSAPTLAIPRTRIQWRNSNACNTYTCNTPIKRHTCHSRGYGGTTCNTNTYNTNTCNTTLTIPWSTYLINLIFVCQRCMVGILFGWNGLLGALVIWDGFSGIFITKLCISVPWTNFTP